MTQHDWHLVADTEDDADTLADLLTGKGPDGTRAPTFRRLVAETGGVEAPAEEPADARLDDVGPTEVALRFRYPRAAAQAMAERLRAWIAHRLGEGAVELVTYRTEEEA